MPPTPDNGAYLALGLAAVFITLASLIGSMVARYRSLQKDMQMLQQLENDVPAR